jgi:SagB-type dehydrogenase family enzyme
VRASARQKGRRARPATAFGRLPGHVTLETQASGQIFARFDGYSVGLGAFSAEAAERAQALRSGVALASLASGRRRIDQEMVLLARRLAGHGLLEYPVGRAPGDDLVVIEPQMAAYWPRTARLGTTDVLALSRFAYMRRRGSAIVLESPRAGALFRICDAKIATVIATLATPRRLSELRRQDGFPGQELFALLVDSCILFKTDADGGSRSAEGDDHLVLWDFHDLLFHTRSTEGRQANPLGGVYAYAAAVPPLPAVRPCWPGKKVDLRTLSAARAEDASPFARLLHQRHSIRSFDDRRPITLRELARFLGNVARVASRWTHREDLGDARPLVAYAMRPYPSAGASYELELYLAVDRCDGLARGFYHYDAGAHALVPIAARTHELHALLTGAAYAMDAPAVPQILVTIAARFGRVTWKYSALAYALILKDVGVLTQTLYLMAADMGLGGCAIGSVNIDLFARMTGIEFHVEGPVGQFALGRGPAASP